MKRTLRHLRQQLITRQFMMFAVVGVVNVCSGVLFSSLFSLILQANVAFVCGYAASLLGSYILNSFFVFFQPLA